jgi:peptidoglycan/xylan/chitin deacetylase (PgdA/CDA1 family)
VRTRTREQVLQLSSAGVEIGSHGRHHEIHHARQPADVRAAELGQSREELTSLLGSPCRWFAFPNGDFLPESAREVERAGYELGFTTASATLDGKTREDRFLLPRLAAPSSLHSFVRAVWWEPTAAADFGGVAAHLAAEP